jgi:membrane-bound lytic murein transglycosylase F
MYGDLPDADRLVLQSYGSVLRRFSEKYGLDWRLGLAVMKAESRFLVTAESHKGARGLMQIMPRTGDELSKALEIKNITHPKDNIHGGVYYLSKLCGMFDQSEGDDRIRLALAAYNAGVGRVYDAQDLAAYLKDDPSSWTGVKGALPLLSKRYYTLHRNVWEDGEPRIAGWFGNSIETLTYVERVMAYYEEYKVLLN